MKVTICYWPGDWCMVVVNGQVQYHGHRSDFLEEAVWYLNKWGLPLVDFDEVAL